MNQWRYIQKCKKGYQCRTNLYAVGDLSADTHNFFEQLEQLLLRLLSVPGV